MQYINSRYLRSSSPSIDEAYLTDAPSSDRGFLLHVFPRQQGGKTTVCAIGRLQNGETFGLVDDRQQPSFYVRQSDSDALARRDGITGVPSDRSTMDGEPVLEVKSPLSAALRRLARGLERDGVRTYEADFSHTGRFLVDRQLNGSVHIEGPWRPGDGVDRVYQNPHLTPASWEPHLAVLALDLETDREASQIWAASLVGTGPDAKHQLEEIHLVGAPTAQDSPKAHCHADETALLQALCQRIRAIDPDVLTGWNVVDFDLTVLQRRCKALGLPFNLGRTQDDSWYQEGRIWGGSRMVVYGRQVLDALHLIRASLQRFEDYRLGTVAQAILGRGKTLQADEDEAMPERIQRAYQQDRAAFCEYCLEDSRLVRDLLAAEGLIELTLSRSLLTGLPLERCWGSVAPFDYLYIGQLHRRGLVAPSHGVDQNGRHSAPGGLVIAPQAGLYRHVFVFDFKSLYPSLIRTFNIDPLAHIQATNRAPDDTITAPNGASFARDQGILPDLLERFFTSRAQARERGDELAAYAYKIIMNSFYGVLATNACRFADNRLAGAITEFGHYVLRWTRQLLQEDGNRILYGDTDSLFVDPGLPADIDEESARQRGRALCQWANQQLADHIAAEWGVESRLELEFEKYYRRLFLPSMRGDAEKGRAKGYAGLRVDQRGEYLDIVGMEAVRRDWTDLAHQLQRELLERLFHDADGDELEQRITDWVHAVRTGQKDDLLVYRKGLRKSVARYTKSSPPHVQAARLLPNPPDVVHYVITRDGPQPLGKISAPLDYNHYVQKQIEPIVRTLAQVCPIDTEAAVKGEISLFPRLVCTTS